MNIRNLTVGVTLLILAGAVSAGYDEGAQAYNRADFKTAFSEFKALAEQGNSNAQVNLGVMYAKGLGVPQNYKEAVKWYRKAAEQGQPLGQVNLGAMYAFGQGVPQSQTEAVKWYRKAAEQGEASAQYNLGYKYVNGQGVPPNLKVAYAWFSVAAANGDVDAPAGRDYLAKVLTTKNLEEAQTLANEYYEKYQSK